jgi:hypothetical protein
MHDSGDSFDIMLQISRRLDWRFLLPDPELGRVAYLGPEKSQLYEALRLFSLSLTQIDEVKGPAEFDILVAHVQSVDKLTAAACLIRPGGYVYAEAYGLLALVHPQTLHRAAGGLSSPNRIRNALNKAGLVDLQAHWHWPDFETCTRIIPLGIQSLFEYAFHPSQNSQAARLQAFIGHWLLSQRLLSATVPCFSILGKRPQKITGPGTDDEIRSSR